MKIWAVGIIELVEVFSEVMHEVDDMVMFKLWVDRTQRMEPLCGEATSELG